MKNIKYLLVFCLGAVTGSICTARFLDERYSRIADEEIESVKQVAKKTIDELKEKVENIKKTEVEKIPEEKTEKTIPDLEVYKGNVGIYASIDNDIEIISDDQFASSDNEKMTIWFYGQDKALLNDAEEPIENVTECLGKDIIDNPEHYFDLINGKNTIYVKNYLMGIDFEVIYLDKSYSKDVLGLEE